MIDKKIYISGPMTGIHGLNYKAFSKAENMLKLKYKTVVNPHKIHRSQTSLTWEEFMMADITALIECDYIYLLPGFQDSRGSKLELYIANELGIGVVNFSFLEERNLS